MCEHDLIRRKMTRRRALGTLGLLGAAGLLGRRLLDRGPIADANAAVDVCTLTPELTIGPYFVEEGLDRSDITGAASTPFIADAVPLYLVINASSALGNCAPLAGVQIDIWHCHAGGLYSDEAANGTSGQTWLRGYQRTDANGNVAFTTIYPGWYAGRTIHIHVMARWFDAGGNTTYQFTTQLFFDEATNDLVMAQAPYNTRGNRSTRNSNDGIYDASMLLDLQANDGGASYSGTIALGLELEATTPDLIFADAFETA